jgi:membrane-bound lytic murein transglycosylase MltF
MNRTISLAMAFSTAVALGLGVHVQTAHAAEAAKQAAADSAPSAEARRLAVTTTAWKGDFDGMLERRAIRFYVPYSRSLYFVDKGRERGIAANLVRDFERWVNKKHAKEIGKRPLTVFVVAATRDHLRADLLEGHADVAVGNIKVLDELAKDVDFVAPDDTAVSAEILVTGPASPAIATLDDLAGKTVHTRKVSSYYLSLTALNDQLKKQGKPEVKIAFVPDALEDEDMLEMLNAGLLQAIVVDDWKAKAWAQLLPKVKVREDIVLRPKTKVGWAIRKQSPKLAAELNEFYKELARKGSIGTRVQREYMSKVKMLHNATAGADEKRFQMLSAYFKKYGDEYRFDPLMLAAQGYQESQLDQNAKSPVGAVGVMQLMPATGSELKVGDIKQAEPNIHAGAKYMDQLMTKYFADATFDEQNRTLFAFASYNCGPGNISRMRKEAEKRGLDPNVWFNNVEIVTADKIGTETTTYVRNIFKYYVAYRLTADARTSAEKLKQEVAPKKQ